MWISILRTLQITKCECTKQDSREIKQKTSPKKVQKKLHRELVSHPVIRRQKFEPMACQERKTL